MNKIYVLYHDACTDGLGSKYAAWKKFGNSASYHPVQYGKPIPDIEDQSEVYILDFSYPRDILEDLNKRCSKVQVLDHHKTAEEALRNLDFAFFDMKKSGAVLSWEYFHPNVPVPPLLLHIQDRDLWTWKKPGTREVLNALKPLREDFPKWDDLAGVNLNDEFMDKWKVISDFEDNYVADRAKGAKHTTLWLPLFIPEHTKLLAKENRFKVAVYNTTLLVSEIGNKLCTDNAIDFAIGWFVNEEGKVCISLRSLPGGMDVSGIAAFIGKTYGWNTGGGHNSAAGTITRLSFLEKLYE